MTDRLLRPAQPMHAGRPTEVPTHGHSRPNRRTLAAPESIDRRKFLANAGHCGAAFLVLETLDHALGRGATVYAELLGYGCSMDAFRVSDPEPNGQGAVESMEQALCSAAVRAHQIDCISAHGTGTPTNDVVETAAIKEVLGPRAYEIPVHAVKSMTGHMIAASGALEAVAAVMTIARRTVPPTINLEKPDRQCDLDYVSDGAREFSGSTVLSNSFGFGGQNASLLFARYS